MGADMSDHFELYEQIFNYLLKADQNLWEAVLKIQDGESEGLTSLVPSFMAVRGELHAELMRPIYQKFPELAEKAGFGESDT